ncbi:cyclopropane-fatty-acyl-phospholipid synthase family protein [Candidatus Puniceispirillum sp.]|nr:cyclopropane-fatty-acyl-phospholipid synthase family protein [Candidatus Puniceispirillum sp.]
MFSRLLLHHRDKLLFSILGNLRYGELTLTMPDQCQQIFSGILPGPKADLQIHSKYAVQRILNDGKIGFCEAFMDGELSSSGLPDLIELAARHDEYLDEKLKTSLLRKWGLRLFHHFRRNNKAGSERNIAQHYDLGNSFYQAWLDPSMAYSSAVFDSEDDDDLTAAQLNKYKRLTELADIKPNDQVLEIGCGWGGFAKYMATEIGANVTAITISREQFDFAKNLIDEAGLNDKVDLRLMDYRDLQGKFDKVVSIEMFEAVGRDYWATYFSTVSKVLRKGGRAVVQSITIDHAAYHSYESQPDFIQRYIFPGGMLPSLTMLQRPLEDAGLLLVSERGYASHYARTLDQWRQRFNAAWPQISEPKFDNRFKRTWELYLAYCEGGFRSGLIDVKQMLLMHK